MADGTQDTWVLEDSMTQSQLHTQPDDLGVSAAVDSEPEGAEPDLEEQDDTETPTQPFVMELPDDSDDSEQDEPGKSATGDKSSLETAEVVVKKPQSAYFLFVAARRDAVKEANPGLNLGGMQKLIAAEWKEMGEEQKKVYEDAAAADKERYAAEVTEIKARGGVVAESSKKSAGSVDGVGFPLARVRKICKTDPDVKTISKEALNCLTALTTYFLEDMSRAAGAVAQSQKRKTVKDDDICKAIHSQPTFEFLRGDFSKPTGKPGSVLPSSSAIPGGARKESTKKRTAPSEQESEQPSPPKHHVPADTAGILAYFGRKQ